MPSPSRSHCTAAPVTKIAASSAWVVWSPTGQATVAIVLHPAGPREVLRELPVRAADQLTPEVEDEAGGAAAERRLDVEAAVERVDPVAQPAQAGAGVEVGAADAVVPDLEAQARV